MPQDYYSYWYKVNNLIGEKAILLQIGNRNEHVFHCKPIAKAFVRLQESGCKRQRVKGPAIPRFGSQNSMECLEVSAKIITFAAQFIPKT